MDILDRVISIVGTQAALASALGIKSPSISGWRKARNIPHDWWADIETLTGGKVGWKDLYREFAARPRASKRHKAARRG